MSDEFFRGRGTLLPPGMRVHNSEIEVLSLDIAVGDPNPFSCNSMEFRKVHGFGQVHNQIFGLGRFISAIYGIA
jgi:hypothetical protein